MLRETDVAEKDAMSSTLNSPEVADASAADPDAAAKAPPGIRFSRRGKAVVVLALVVLGLLFVYGVRAIIWPFIWAGVLAYLLAPLVTWLCQRTRLHRFWVSLLLVGFLVGVIVLLFAFGYPTLSRELEGLRLSLPNIVQNLESTLGAYAQINLLGLEGLIGLSGERLASALDAAAPAMVDAVLHLALNVVELFLKFLLCFFATFYLLLEADRFGVWVRRMVPAPYRQELGMLGQQVDHVLGRFLRGALLLVAIMSVATYIGLRFLGVPYALVLAPVAGVLELIPLAGPFLAATPAVLLALVYPSPFGWSPVVSAIVVALMYTVLRLLEDYLIIPNVIGRFVHLNPVLTIFAVLSGGALFGVSGMLLAIPTAAILRIVFNYLYTKLTT